MKLFITGGTGFLGTELITQLLKNNHEIVALTRQKGRLQNCKEVIGNLENIGSWKQELKDCDAVIHCAAPVEFWGKWEKFYNEITLATLELLIASDEQNVQRFIYISSESVLQYKNDLIDIDETFPYPEEPNSLYGKSKMLAEQGIIEFNGKIESIILRPTFIYGKGVKAIDTMKEAIQSGKFMWLNKGDVWVEMVYVKNVVEAIVQSLKNGKSKNIYNITDQKALKAKDFFSQLLKTQNIETPNKSIPAKLLLPIAGLLEKIWTILQINSNPPLTRFDLSFLSMNRKYKAEKAINELNYKPIYTTGDALNEMCNLV